jgi:hypothetical protein
MNPPDKSPTIIIHEDSDSLEELSEYLDVLSSSARREMLGTQGCTRAAPAGRFRPSKARRLSAVMHGATQGEPNSPDGGSLERLRV